MEKKNENAKPETNESGAVLEKLGNLVKPMDILVVDDVYANRFLIETILGDAYVCEGAGSSAEMFRTLLRKKTRLILLDLMMPFENGFEALEKLKADPSLKDIPVIVVSAKDSREDVVRAMGLGAADYVVKPVEEGLLLRKIRKILGDQEGMPAFVPPAG